MIVTKTVKVISLGLGISMFLFGILKFIQPFKGWYSVQVYKSQLGAFSYWLGIAGEMIAGLILLSSVLLFRYTQPKRFPLALAGASALVVVIMAAGIYVHLHPQVPASVLPLKIKPPYIPIFFLSLAVVNIIFIQTKSRANKNQSQTAHLQKHG
jgi:hypothetical protein